MTLSYLYIMCTPGVNVMQDVSHTTKNRDKFKRCEYKKKHFTLCKKMTKKSLVVTVSHILGNSPPPQIQWFDQYPGLFKHKKNDINFYTRIHAV